LQNPGVPNQATVTFYGSRWRMFGIMLSGYILMVFSAGIYRFWLTTNKRRFYWAHTKINGESLEYTGTAIQLLVGFLFAVAIFLPVYGFFFYLSTQSPQITFAGYFGVATFLYFLFGYASFRARRFLLSRTLWRGIRFQLSGNAWAYAFRRLFWTLLTIATLGLAFPFMSASLWKYRYSHTWFGDRQCQFGGSWRHIAIPYYAYYFIIAGFVIAGIYTMGETSPNHLPSQDVSSLALLFFGGAALVTNIAYFHLLAHITSAMLSSVTIGRAKLNVSLKARSLFGLQIANGVVFLIIVSVFILIINFALGEVIQPMFLNNGTDLAQILQLGWYNLAIFGGIYLAFMATIAIVSELILKLGFWRLVARGAIIENEGDLRSVRAAGQESPLAGEGLADALNAGAY